MEERLKSCSASTSSPIPIQKSPMDLRGTFRNFPPSPDSSAKRAGIPPPHPHHFPPPPPASYLHHHHHQQQQHQQILTSRTFSHSRSLSQPPFFSLDSLPSISDTDAPPLPLARTKSGSGSGRAAEEDGLQPPAKSHRRSASDTPFDFRLAGLPPLPHQPYPGYLVSPKDGKAQSQPVKQESEWDRERDGGVERKSDGDVAADDLFSAYMNLDSLDTLNSSGTEGRREDLDSRASGSKTNNNCDSSENEAESSVNDESGGSSSAQVRKEGNKRSAAGYPAALQVGSRHCRSVSMDSFMGRLSFVEESPKLPPSPGPRVVQHSHTGSMDGMTSSFSLEFGNGEFSGVELKKIMANEKLAEIAMSDPKRAKRILANRQSAARSKERKMRYISELEHKVQTLQTEATTLSAQLTLLQRDSAGLTNQNNELKFRLQAMKQQAHLRDALNEALTAEVQRLKHVSGESQLANSLNQQMQLNPQMFQMQQLQKQHQQQQQQQPSQIPHFQTQPQQQSQQQQQTNNDASNHDTDK